MLLSPLLCIFPSLPHFTATTLEGTTLLLLCTLDNVVHPKHTSSTSYVCTHLTSLPYHITFTFFCLYDVVPPLFLLYTSLHTSTCRLRHGSTYFRVYLLNTNIFSFFFVLTPFSHVTLEKMKYSPPARNKWQPAPGENRFLKQRHVHVQRRTGIIGQGN